LKIRDRITTEANRIFDSMPKIEAR